MNELARVLCVDDDPMVLEGLERNLGEHFEIVVANNGHDALCLIQAEAPFAAIVSDMRMPQMNGAEFLARARTLAPDATRLLLTGYSETNAAIAAVNEGYIFRFLSKPCAPELLLRHLADAVRMNELVTSERQLMENTLNGAIQMMADLLAVASPAIFERARQLRARVGSAARLLGYEAAWEYETAALLARVGCIALPLPMIEKAWAGNRLTVEERATYDSHPMIAHKLISAIPRLHKVAEIVRLQRGAVSGDASIDRGVELLRAALHLDELLGRRVPVEEALGVLGSHHPTAVVQALATHARNSAQSTVYLVKLADVTIGWVLDADVRSPNGALLCKAGSVLSPVLIESLRRFKTGAGIVEPLHLRAH